MTVKTLLTVPAFKVEVDGKELPANVIAAVESVRFDEDINMPSMFILKLLISDFEKGAWRFIELEDFKLGREVKLYMGMDSTVEMLSGEITSLEPSFGGSFSTIEIRGYDRLHRLRFGKKQRTFSDMKDSEIASKIAGDWGLSSKVDDSAITHPYLYQNNQSDLEFLLDRAKRIRYEVFVKDRTLYFRPAKEDDAKSLTLEYMIDFEDFSAKLSARYAGNEVRVRGWDFVNKKLISSTAKKGNEITKMSAKELGTNMTEKAFGSSSTAVVDEYFLDASDAEKIAIARYNTNLVESVIGEGRGAGIPQLRAGRTIEVKGIGSFSGVYYVTSTSHIIDNTGYNTSFRVRRVGI